MRLDKFLADAGCGTRKEVKLAIKKKLVTVNDTYQTDPGVSVSKEDIVCYQGKTVKEKSPKYFMMNKPAGCVSATKDADRTVLFYVKDIDAKDLFPVGRLDKDTEGLLLLTDDGLFAHNLTSPKKDVSKVYYFEGEGILDNNAVEKVKDGLDIGDDKLTKPAFLEVTETDVVHKRVIGKITISEGRYHQVKRMLKVLGVTITYLKRIQIGPVKLDDNLEPGQYRKLSKEEYMLLSQGRSSS